MKAIKSKPKFCSICTEPIDEQKDLNGEVWWTDGHNAEPINGGRCCTLCNDNVVIPARLAHFKLKIDVEN